MHVRRGQIKQGAVFGAMRNSTRSCQSFVNFLFPLLGNRHRRKRVEAAHDSIALRIKTTKLALGEMRPPFRRRLLPQQAQIAPLTPPSRTLSIRVCEFLFWTSSCCGRGKGRRRASILRAANGKRGRLSRQIELLLVVVVVGDEKRDILLEFRDRRRRRRSRWLPPR